MGSYAGSQHICKGESWGMEQIEEKKTKSPYRALIWIPIMLALFVCSIFFGTYADVHLLPWNPEAHGHPIPLLSIILPGLTLVVGAVVSLISIIVTIVRCLKK